MPGLYFIGRRFNSSASMPRSLAAMRVVASVGVAISVAALVVAASIGRGFEGRYRRSLMDFNAHVVVMGQGEMSDPAEAMAGLDPLRNTSAEELSLVRRWGWALPHLKSSSERIRVQAIERMIVRLEDAAGKGVVAAVPFLYREALVLGGGKIRGVTVKGIEAGDPNAVRGLSISIFGGPAPIAEALRGDRAGPMPALVGAALARELGLGAAGGAMRLMIPKPGQRRGDKMPFEEVRAVGTFESGMNDYDSQFLMMSLPDARRLFGAPSNLATGVELSLAEPQMADAVSERIGRDMGPIYRGVTWSELNRELLSAVRLERFVSGAIMAVMVAVAALNIVAVLVLTAIHRIHEVAILKALGLSDRSVAALFLRGGLSLGARGVLAGLGVGVALAAAVGSSGIVRLDPAVYLIDSLPIDISPTMCGMIALFCVGVVFFTSLAIARSLSRMSVAEGLSA